LEELAVAKGGFKAVKKVKAGKRMTKTGRWKLTPKRGRQREFSGTLLRCINIGKSRIAIFSVPKKFD
jgi:hypothetical protein